MKTQIDRILLKNTLISANKRLYKKHQLKGVYPTDENSISRIIELLNDRSPLSEKDIAIGITDDSLDDIRLLMSVADGSIAQLAEKMKSITQDPTLLLF